MTKLTKSDHFQVWTCERYDEPSVDSETLARLWQFQDAAAQGEDFLSAYSEAPVDPKTSILFN